VNHVKPHALVSANGSCEKTLNSRPEEGPEYFKCQVQPGQTNCVNSPLGDLEEGAYNGKDDATGYSDDSKLTLKCVLHNHPTDVTRKVALWSNEENNNTDQARNCWIRQKTAYTMRNFQQMFMSAINVIGSRTEECGN